MKVTKDRQNKGFKAKVTLVAPPLSGEQRYGRLAKAGVYMPPLGLGILASILKEDGFDVNILDCEALKLDVNQAVNRIISVNPDFVGITSVTLSIYSSGELAKALKVHRPELCLILGGPHVTVVPEETMNVFPEFDVGVIGEGEQTIKDLLNTMLGGNDLGAVKGIVYRCKKGIFRSPNREFLKNLDILPFPAWDLYPDLKKHYKPSAFGFFKLPSMSLVTSRGCYGRCSFCNQGGWGNNYREHSAKYVLEMVKVLYYEYGIRDLMIYDGTFGINRRRLIKLCEILIKEDLDLVWSCNFRVEMADLNLLRLMKKAGCWSIAYGIESGSQQVLDFLQKDITPDLIERAIRLTKESGILSKAYMMVGTPTETRSSISETLNFLMRLDLDLLTVNSFTPFPGTLDYERAHKYGQFDKDWRNLNEHSLAFVPNGLSKSEIYDDIRLITRKFYLRPGILWRYLKMSFNPNYLRSLFLGFLSFLEFILPKKSDLK